ncbi:hypothetical protein J6590_060982 [Homalodisca vitripennis]|nr:hypothetical protein J6590_060982 [Homalodisca vitripennis]
MEGEGKLRSPRHDAETLPSLAFSRRDGGDRPCVNYWGGNHKSLPSPLRNVSITPEELRYCVAHHNREVDVGKPDVGNPDVGYAGTRVRTARRAVTASSHANCQSNCLNCDNSPLPDWPLLQSTCYAPLPLLMKRKPLCSSVNGGLSRHVAVTALGSRVDVYHSLSLTIFPKIG